MTCAITFWLTMIVNPPGFRGHLPLLSYFDIKNLPCKGIKDNYVVARILVWYGSEIKLKYVEIELT